MWCVFYKFDSEYFGSEYHDFYFDTEEEARADISAELADQPDLKYTLLHGNRFVERNY